jgi:hypothetical protein
MSNLKYASFGLVALGTLIALPVTAQPLNGVKEINFDLWCQEQAKLPSQRCDKRTPEDEITYEAFRNKIEEYEIPYLQEKEKGEQLNRTILQYDPVDNPVSQNPWAQQQLPIDPSQPAPP